MFSYWKFCTIVQEQWSLDGGQIWVRCLHKNLLVGRQICYRDHRNVSSGIWQRFFFISNTCLRMTRTFQGRSSVVQDDERSERPFTNKMPENVGWFREFTHEDCFGCIPKGKHGIKKTEKNRSGGVFEIKSLQSL